MIVKKDFFCVIEKVTYKKGDTYKGNRKDIAYLLEEPTKKEDKRKKVKLETKK